MPDIPPTTITAKWTPPLTEFIANQNISGLISQASSILQTISH